MIKVTIRYKQEQQQYVSAFLNEYGFIFEWNCYPTHNEIIFTTVQERMYKVAEHLTALVFIDDIQNFQVEKGC